MPGKALDSPGPCLPPPWSGALPPSPSLRALRITTPSGWQTVSGLGISCDRCESGVSGKTGLPTLPRASCLPALVPRLSHILTTGPPRVAGVLLPELLDSPNRDGPFSASQTVPLSPVATPNQVVALKSKGSQQCLPTACLGTGVGIADAVE